MLEPFSLVTNLCAASWEGCTLGNGGNCFLCLSSLGNLWSNGELNRKRIKHLKWGKGGFHQCLYVFYWALSRWRRLPHGSSLAITQSTEAQDTEPRVSLFLDLLWEGAVPWRNGVAVHWYCMVCHSHNPSCSSSSHFKAQPNCSWCYHACLLSVSNEICKAASAAFLRLLAPFLFLSSFPLCFSFCFLKLKKGEALPCRSSSVFIISLHWLNFFSSLEVADFGGSLVSPVFSLNNRAYLMRRVQRESALPTIWSLVFWHWPFGKMSLFAELRAVFSCAWLSGSAFPSSPAVLTCLPLWAML